MKQHKFANPAQGNHSLVESEYETQERQYNFKLQLNSVTQKLERGVAQYLKTPNAEEDD